MLQSAAARWEASQALEAATEATALSSSRQKESANHNARCMVPSNAASLACLLC